MTDIEAGRGRRRLWRRIGVGAAFGGFFALILLTGRDQAGLRLAVIAVTFALLIAITRFLRQRRVRGWLTIGDRIGRVVWIAWMIAGANWLRTLPLPLPVLPTDGPWASASDLALMGALYAVGAFSGLLLWRLAVPRRVARQLDRFRARRRRPALSTRAA